MRYKIGDEFSAEGEMKCHEETGAGVKMSANRDKRKGDHCWEVISS
jgi:hypothetical protein